MIEIHDARTAFPVRRCVTRNPGAVGDSIVALGANEIDDRGRLLKHGYDRLIAEGMSWMGEQPDGSRIIVLYWSSTRSTKIGKEGVENAVGSFPIALG